jgi:serine/threonine protein phosphatase PrpC
MLASTGRSDPGRRKNNEDAYACDPDIGFFLVADGMGGHTSGEVASDLALKTVQAFLLRSHDSTDFSWPYGIDRNASLNANRLRTAVHLANRRVFREAETHDEFLGMGTTIVAALALNGRLSVANVGDSRAYLFRDGALKCLTVDDSWIAAFAAQNPGTDTASLASHPMRHVLTKVLGATEQVDIHLVECEIADGDVVLLCSDGLHSIVADEEITAVLAGQPDLEKSAAALVERALGAGGRDNVTVVLARANGQPS